MGLLVRIPSPSRSLWTPRFPRGTIGAAFLLSAALAAPAHAADPPPAAGTPGAAGAPAETPPVPGSRGVSEDERTLVENAPRQGTLVPEMIPVKPPPPGILRNPLGLCRPDPCVSPFLTETDVRLRLRTFYFDRENPDESRNQAWAFGGWLQVTSGWFRDWFQAGVTGYTSQPVYAPEEHDGTSLLAPGQEGITILGQAFARARWKEYAVLTAYRQSVNDGYVGPQDNRMIPNTFEGVTVRGTVKEVTYGSGWLWEMKPRNRDDFISMGEQAGADSDEGLGFGSLLWKPSKAWEAFFGDYYTPDVFNTAFGYAKHTRCLTDCLEGQFGLQFTDQRSVGDEEIGEFETWNVGVGARLVWKYGLTIGAAFHATGDDAGIRSPYGSWPGWLSLIETDFDRANEKAAGVAVKYDFGKGGPMQVPGLFAVLAYATGWDREDPATGASLADTHEFDVDLTYDVPRVKGLQLRLRNAWVGAGGEQTGWQVRLVANWDIDLL
jgi:hypothetical protein